MRMLFAIGQNSVLEGSYHLRHRLPFATGNLIERRVTQNLRTVDLQRVLEVNFGNVIDMRDDVNSHPGVNCTHISLLKLAILILETLHRVISIDSSKSQYPQHEK